MRNGVVLKNQVNERILSSWAQSHSSYIRLRAVSLSSKSVRGKDRKTSKHASVIVSVTCVRRCRELLAARASKDSQSRANAYFFLRSSPGITDCSQSSYIVSGIVHSMAFSCIVVNSSIAVC